MSEFGVSPTGAYVTQKGPQSGIRPKNPLFTLSYPQARTRFEINLLGKKAYK